MNKTIIKILAKRSNMKTIILLLVGVSLTIHNIKAQHDNDSFGSVYRLKSISEGEVTKYYIVKGFAMASHSLRQIHIPTRIDGIPVMGVEAEAFKDDYTITAVYIEDGVRNIGNGAFDGCTAINSVRLPSTLETIGNYAFRHCSSLAGTVELPTSVSGWGGSSFLGCSSLEKVIVPPNYHTIPANVFKTCISLKEVYIVDGAGGGKPNGSRIIKLGNTGAFEDCHPNLRIYVPRYLVDQYRSDSDWKFYQSKIYGF